jgi:hypothetical protein
VGDCIGDLLFAVTRWLNGRLDVANLFKSETVLIVVVYNKVLASSLGGECTNEIILQFADFKDEDTQFVGDIGDIIIAFFTPDRELLSNFLALPGDLWHQ